MIRLLSVVVLVACGGARSAPDQPQGPQGSGHVVQQGSGAATPEVRPADPHPTEAECDALFAHGVKLGLATRPADHQLGEAEQAQVSAQLREGFLAECRQLSRTHYQCGIAATTNEQLARCGSR